MARLFRVLIHRFRTKTFRDFLISLWPSLFRSDRIRIYGKRLEEGSFRREQAIRSGAKISKGSAQELRSLRSGVKRLPWELQCDLFDGVEDFFIASDQGEIRHISWVYYRGDPNRFLVLGKTEAEIKSSLTFPAFRGQGLFPAVLGAITRYLRQAGFQWVYICVDEENKGSIRGIEKAGFSCIGSMRVRKVLGIQVNPRLLAEKIRGKADSMPPQPCHSTIR